MTRIVMLDTGPLGMAVHPRPAIGFRRWLNGLLRSDSEVCIPEIADYELRRELLRARLATSVHRLDLLAETLRYEPISTDIIRRAAELRARTRQVGRPTADPAALDGDMILAATGLTLAHDGDDTVIATANLGHRWPRSPRRCGGKNRALRPL